MLNFSASNVVSWPTPQSTAVPAVTPITPVKPAPGAGRDAQAGLGFDQKRQSAQQSRDGSSPQSAPKLPRDTDASAPAQSTQSREAEAVAQRAAKEASVREIEQRASEKEAIHQHLREVLSNVWQASAAVVERALGRDAAVELPGPSSGASSALAAMAASLTGRRPVLLAPVSVVPSVGPQVVQAMSVPDTSDTLSGARQTQSMTDVVAYDERGNGTVTPHEAGSLVDHRV